MAGSESVAAGRACDCGIVLMFAPSGSSRQRTLTSILTQAASSGCWRWARRSSHRWRFDLRKERSWPWWPRSRAFWPSAGFLRSWPWRPALASEPSGSINGVMVSAVRTNPFVTTLSTLLDLPGGGVHCPGGPADRQYPGLPGIDSGFTLGTTFVPFRGVLFPGAHGPSWLVLRQTVFGQHIYALGGNAEAARLAGIRTVRLRVVDFRPERPRRGRGHDPFPVLAARGQARHGDGLRAGLDRRVRRRRGLASGRPGQRPGAAAGCLLLQALRTQITMSGFPEEYRTLVTGVVILIFAAADALARRNERA